LGIDLRNEQRGAAAVIADGEAHRYRHRNPAQRCPLTAGYDLEGGTRQGRDHDLKRDSLKHLGKL
jgi:hypothetical protein